jgi:sterol desaturase/sphingolipid hydroxylase (fatty acid hydroxylase superfamily)
MDLFKDSAVLLVSLPVYLVLIVVEIAWGHWHNRPTYSLGGTLTNFTLAGLNVALDVCLRGFWFVALSAVYQNRLVELDQPWAYWTVLLVGQDFLFYWLHRIDHSCRLFWAVHATHHSSAEFNLTVGVRPSVLQPVYRFAWFLPLALLGGRPEDVLFAYSVTQLYGVLVHTQHVGHLGPLEWVMVTPSHHRVHHGSNPQYLDKNFGMLLIVWDRLFGTFEKEGEEVRFGLSGQQPATANPVRAIVGEWAAIGNGLRQSETLRMKAAAVLWSRARKEAALPPENDFPSLDKPPSARPDSRQCN